MRERIGSFRCYPPVIYGLGLVGGAHYSASVQHERRLNCAANLAKSATW